jgi:hypothetical protein
MFETETAEDEYLYLLLPSFWHGMLPVKNAGGEVGTVRLVQRNIDNPTYRKAHYGMNDSAAELTN